MWKQVLGDRDRRIPGIYWRSPAYMRSSPSVRVSISKIKGGKGIARWLGQQRHLLYQPDDFQNPQRGGREAAPRGCHLTVMCALVHT